MSARGDAMIVHRPAQSMSIDEQIFKRVLSFIHRPVHEDFESLALEVFRYQFDSVRPYRRFCEERGISPSAVRRVDDIPAVSNLAFKYADLSIDDAASSPGALVFLTSGTTEGRERRGRHIVPRSEIYRASALAHLRAMLFPDERPLAMLALHPSADAMPESSLARMIGWCVEEFGTGARLVAASRDRVDTGAAIRFLAEAEARREPVCILGTTAAFAAVFSDLRERGAKYRLANGSRMMDTGGA